MKTTHRPYAEDAGDFRRFCTFVIDHAPQIRAWSTWPLGRVVDWKYGLYDNKTAVAGFCDANAHLWFDAFGSMVGFAVDENGDADFAIVTLPGYRFLFEEMLQWALAGWATRGPRTAIEITAQQTAEACVLEQYGFHRQATFTTHGFDLTRPAGLPPALEPGFRIVDMATHPDYRQQRLMRADGFGGRTEVDEETLQHELQFYNHTHAGPIYYPACDLCVMGPDGQFVAGAEALIDARNAEAEIERICTRAAFRRRGFARAVIRACLNRLHNLGLERAYITGYSREAIALYGSLGHVAESENWIYMRGAAEDEPGGQG